MELRNEAKTPLPSSPGFQLRCIFLAVLILKFSSNSFLLLFPLFHNGKTSDTLRGLGEDTCSHLWTIMESQSRGASVGFGVGQAYVQTRPY